MLYIYYRGAVSRQASSTIVVVTLLLLFSFLTVVLFSADPPIIYLLVVTAVLLSSIVISVGFARGIFFFSAITLLVLSGFRVTENQIFSFDRLLDDLGGILMLLVFIWIITNIARIGYNEIEHSYKKALDYASELEATNKDLDKKVKHRTKMLEESLKRQANAVYSAAVVGSVTRPMLHDLATPLSSFGIALDMMKNNKRKDYKEIHSSALIALTQINEIISNGRDLMRNKVKKTYFYPSRLLEISLQILQNEINVNRIEIVNNVDLKTKLWGSPSLFIRVMTNLILNAIQELHESEKERRIILLESKSIKGKVQLVIEDSGRGIPKEKLDKIFEADFTSKETETNLGFGLPFVKSTLEEHFKAYIKVDSKVDKFTRIEIEFPAVVRRKAKP